MREQAINQPTSRFSLLAPLAPAQRLRLAQAAVEFFGVFKNEEACAVLGKPRPVNQFTRLTGMDFMDYLEKTQILPSSQRYMHRLEDLLSTLVEARILKEVGQTGSAYMGTQYAFLREHTNLERQGWMWLSPALGPEFIRDQFSAVTLQIVGHVHGKIAAGTGLPIAPGWLLTCGHVITGMNVASEQSSQGSRVRVLRTLVHDRVDVGLIQIEPAVSVLPGLAFRDPRVAEDVFTLGYPRVPLSVEPALVMHKGEVTSDGLRTMLGRFLFLFSATARPGNSGGPIVSSTGHVVGIVTEQLVDQDQAGTSPFYAGIRTSEIIQAVWDLEPSIVMPVEDYS